MKEFLIGDSIVKKSGKPFKSGSKIGTVKELTINSQCPNKLNAVRLAEDDSVVNIIMLEKVTTITIYKTGD